MNFLASPAARGLGVWDFGTARGGRAACELTRFAGSAWAGGEMLHAPRLVAGFAMRDADANAWVKF